MHFSFFVFPQVVQKHELGDVEKHILIAYFIINICAKNYRNRTVHVKIIASQRRDVLDRRCSISVTSVYFDRRRKVAIITYSHVTRKWMPVSRLDESYLRQWVWV